MTAGHATRALEERDHAPDPVNALVDLAEHAIRTVIEHGGEVALRARLARLLPAPPPAAPVADAAAFLDIERALALSGAQSLLAACERRARLGAARDQIAAARRVIGAEIDALRRPGAPR